MSKFVFGVILIAAVICNGLADAEDICSLPLVPGPCRAEFINYAYYSEEKACKVFYYGGCGGNANNFKSLEECERACVKN